MQNQQKWYQQPATVVVFLIFFFPVGLYLMWKNDLWSKTARVIVSAFFGLLILGNLLNDKSRNPQLGEYSSFGHNTDIYCGSSNYINLKDNGKLEFYSKVSGERFKTCASDGNYTIDKNNNLTISGLNNPNTMQLDSQFNGEYIWTKDKFDIPCFKKNDNEIVLTNYGKK